MRKHAGSTVAAAVIFFLLHWMHPVSEPKAENWNAASCSQSDVQSAINKAKDGDAILIPAGICSWAAPVSFSKALTIRGAGETQTRIAGGRFDITVPDGKSWRISNMGISGASFVNVGGASKSFRIDHITLTSPTGHNEGRIFWFQPSGSDYLAGVVDHVRINDPRAIQFHYRGSRTDGGNGSWMRDLGLGGPDAVYIEDSTIHHSSHNVSTPVTDCEGGGRFVFRYNTVTNSYIEMHDAIVNNLRGCRKWEIYKNTFHMSYDSEQCTYVRIRSGTGVIFNNVFDEKPDCDDGISFHLYRTYQTDGDPWGSRCGSGSGNAILNSASDYPRSCSSGAGCVKIDGSSANPDGYPCRDQIGTDGNAPQVSRPALLWNNRTAGRVATVKIESGAPYYAENRDYCNAATAMPAVCNGVATEYKPYPYPHPLTRTSTNPKTPEPPSGLTVP